LWWGHRIPAYLVKFEGEPPEDLESKWVVGHDENEARKKAEEKFPGKKFTLEQDPDVLDTWFSSGLFPFSIFGWPDETEDLKLFYPNTLLETGHDILFFWVARMVVLGITLTGKVPFKQVYLHAMVRDAHGRKMSKSLGNVIDPVDVIEGISLENLQNEIDKNTNIDPKEREKAKKAQKSDFPDGIAECGTDALRFALCAYTLQARDINLDVKRVEGYRNFCNKIWNAFKFAMMNLGTDYVPTDDSGFRGLSLCEKWILSRTNFAINQSNEGFQKFAFPQATTAIFNFWLYELCDFYLELMKPIMQDTSNTEESLARKKSYRDILYTCLDTGLRLIHPFMPFLSEELYQRLPRRPKDKDCPSICLAAYPENIEGLTDEESEKDFNTIIQAIHAIRSLRASYFKPKDVVTVYLCVKKEDLASLFQRETLSINTMTKSEATIVPSTEQVPAGCILSTLDEFTDVHLLVKGRINIEEEIGKLKKSLAAAQKSLETLTKQMKDPQYETKIPEVVRLQNSERAATTNAEISGLEISIKNFESLL